MPENFLPPLRTRKKKLVNAPKTQHQLEAMRKRDRTSGDAEEIHVEEEEEEDEEDQEEDQEEEKEEEDNEGEDKASEVDSELPPKVKEATKKFKKLQSGKRKKRSLQVCEKPFLVKQESICPLSVTA